MQFIEKNCTVIHQGITFTANGAYKTDTIALVYLVGSPLKATDWHGNLISTDVEILSRWKQKGSRMTAIRVLIDNKWWHGRYGSDWSQACKLRKDTNKRRRR